MGLVVTACVEREFAEEFAGFGVDDSDFEAVDEQDDARVFVGPPDADVMEFACIPERDGATRVDFVVADS